MEELQNRITTALAREEARAELIANRVRLILFAIFTLIAIANAGVVESTTNLVNFGALLIGYIYGGTVYFAMRRLGYRPSTKYITTLLDIFLVHCVLFIYTRMDVPSVGLKNYVFMIIFPIIALTVFRYDPKFTWLTGSFAVVLYLLLFGYLFFSQAVTFDKGYSSELFTEKVTIAGQLTKMLILCAFVIIAAYLARYTRGLFVKLVSTETAVRVEKEALERDLELASQVQVQLLPKEYPSVKGIQMSGRLLAGKFVGGDYYDFLKLSDKSVMVVIADVSGHGVPAALIMAEVRASVQLLKASAHGLIEMAERLNSLLLESTARKDYVTLFAGEINASRNSLRYINAGHPPPLWCSGRAVRRLPGRTVGLGIVPRLPNVKVQEVAFKLGHVLVCYTDGITERVNTDGVQYGEERIDDFVKRNVNVDPDSFATKLLQEVTSFGGGAAFEDDVTVAIVKRV
jgi:hypothetical protein